MTENAVAQFAIYMLTLLTLAKPLGWYMACIYQNQPIGVNRWLTSVENFIYRLSRINPNEEMRWTDYAIAVLAFNLLGILSVFTLQRLQSILPFNPQQLPDVNPDLAFNTAISFATNTNWQAYSGELTMSYLTQMLGLTVQNFLSAATGMAVLAAFSRGFTRRNSNTLGNFWVDLTRSILYILLPLSLLWSLALVGQGVVQTFNPYQTIPLTEKIKFTQPQLDAYGQTWKDEGGNTVMETL